MPRCSNQRTAGNRGMNSRGCAAAIPVRNGSRGQAECVCTRFSSIPVIRIEFPSRYPLPARFVQMTAAKPGNQLITACIHNFFRILQRKLAIACTGSRSIRRARTRCSCINIGTRCAATTRVIRGRRSAEICQPISDFRSTCTRTSRKRSMSCRSRAIPSIIRRAEGYACIAAAQAATNGKRSPKVCRSGTVM